MKKIILTNILLFVTVLSNAQTTPTPTENYVYNTTCLDADCIKKTETIQYFDNLGRSKQIINVKASPTGKDVVIPVEYDALGRQTKDYLPVPQSGTQNGAVYNTPLSNTSAIYGSEKIYSEKILETSPLERIQQQIQVGNDWATKPINFAYDTNSSADAVKKFTTVTTWENEATKSVLSNSGVYAVGQLQKNTTKDEDGNETIAFKNGWGQTILERKIVNANEKADTYFVYNEYDKLAYVIPPLAATASSLDATTLDNLCYQYKYDGRYRLVEKKLPGKGWEYRVYDKQDRLVLSQDANLRSGNNNFGTIGWLFTKYDQFGRIVYTGFIDDASDRKTMQTAVNNTTTNSGNNESRSATPFTSNGMDVYYTQSAYPTNNMAILTVNYYDTYPPLSSDVTIPNSIINQEVLKQPGQSITGKNTRNLPLASYLKNIEDDNWTKNYSYYDTKGRVIGTYSVNHLGGYTKTETELDFAGIPQRINTYHKRLNTDTEKVITETFEYDSQNKLILHKHQVNSNPVEILAQNTYNELLQLITKKVGGTNASSPLQTIDYAYNIRGWMTKINDPQNLNGRLFGYEMKYQNPINATANYNGNIAEIDWKTSNDGILKRYSYQYDALNRLVNGAYSETASTTPVNDFYNESVSYDMNGNITHLNRNSKNSQSNTPIQIDNLAYVYSGNRLTSVTDSSTNYSGYPEVSGNTISYDVNGNMIDHLDKGILSIAYNYLNLPEYVKFNDFIITRLSKKYVNTSYNYRADGVKLRKIYFYKDPAQPLFLASTVTDYLDGFQYETAKTYAATGSPTLKFVPTAEGYYNFENNKYIYTYTDHLGNVRLSYFNNGSAAEALEENNYYPFGLKHEGYNVLTGNPVYKYQYNGKELQAETGWNDYGARMYMSDIGRWGVVDPLTEKYYSYNSYNYASNNPIRYVDPDGRDGMVTGKGTEDDPYIVTANYYYSGLNKYQAAGISNSVAEYNNGGKARAIQTNAGVIYVKFNLSVTEAKDMASAINAAKADKVDDSNGKTIRFGNYVQSGTIDDPNATAEANRSSITSDTDKVMKYPGMDYASKFKNDFSHEIGHNLGGVHGDPGQMMDPEDSILTITDKTKNTVVTTFKGNPITNDAIRAIIGRMDMTKILSDGKTESPYGIVDSKYITPEEKSKVNSVGSNGKLTSKK